MEGQGTWIIAMNSFPSYIIIVIKQNMRNHLAYKLQSNLDLILE